MLHSTTKILGSVAVTEDYLYGKRSLLTDDEIPISEDITIVAEDKLRFISRTRDDYMIRPKQQRGLIAHGFSPKKVIFI